MRKLLTVAVAASATLAVATAAIADPNDNEAKLTVTASPTKAGTKDKPKHVKLGFRMDVNKPGTTVEVIEMLLPKGIKISGKGFKKCDADALAQTGISACPSGSKAGPKGSANALLEGSSPAPLNFDVHPFVAGSNELIFYLSQRGGQLQTVVHGKISNKGRKMAITIPKNLRQPVPGTDATLTGINQVFSGKAKKHYIVSSTGCPKGGWKFGGNLIFATRADGSAPPPDEARETKVKCK